MKIFNATPVWRARGRRAALLAVWLCGLHACAGPELPPPAPEIDIGSMAADVQAQFEAALADWRDAEDDAAANGRLGMLLDAYDLPTQASLYYERARFFDPDKFRWVYLHGLALVGQGEHRSAIAALTRALELRPGYPAAELALADAQVREGAFDAAAELYRGLLERNPGFARAHLGYGSLLLEQGDPEAAIAALETALGLSNRYGQAHYLLARAHRELGNAERAKLHAALFERYRLLSAEHKDPLRQEIADLNISASRQLERALLLTARGDHAAAADEYEAIAAGPDDSLAARVNLIAAYGELGEFAAAERNLQAALALDPDSIEAHDNAGVLRLKQRRFGEAAAAFRRAIDVDPDYPVAYRNLGVVAELEGRLDDAIDRYRHALALDPYDRQTRHFLARALLADRRPAEAVEAIGPIVEFPHPQRPRYRYLLGRAQSADGQLEAAADNLQAAAATARLRGMNDLAETATTELEQVRQRLTR